MEEFPGTSSIGYVESNVVKTHNLFITVWNAKYGCKKQITTLGPSSCA